MGLPRPLRDAALALSLLTAVPTGVSWPSGERTGVAGWFAAVGVALGSAVTLPFVLDPVAVMAGGQPLVSAAVIVTSLALATRFLHWDGLADVADAWWGGATIERRLEIMRDSATGAFGATALVLTGLLQVAAVSSLMVSGMYVGLFVAVACARLAPVCAAWLGSPAREGGLGRSVMGLPDGAGAVVTAASVAAVLWSGWTFGGLAGAALAGAGIALALVVPHLISRRMGGVTGDVMGASVLVVETLLLVIAAFALGSSA